MEVTDTAGLGIAWGFHPVDVAGLPGGQAAHREGYKADIQGAFLDLNGATRDHTKAGGSDQPYWRVYAANEEGEVFMLDYAPERGQGWDMQLPDGRVSIVRPQQLAVGKSIESSLPAETSESPSRVDTGPIRELVLVNVRSSGSEPSSGTATDIVGRFQAGREAHGGPPAPLEAYIDQHVTAARMDLAAVRAGAAGIRGSPQERVNTWAKVAEGMRTGDYGTLREEIGKELQEQEARRTQAEQRLERGFSDDQTLKAAEAHVEELRAGLTWVGEQKVDAETDAAEGKRIVTEVVTGVLAAAEGQLGNIGPGGQMRISQEASQQIWYLRGLLGIINTASAHQ